MARHYEAPESLATEFFDLRCVLGRGTVEHKVGAVKVLSLTPL